jgi:hypothetical protein
VIRALPIIVQAILLSRPTMPLPEARRYAKVLQEEAARNDYDPFTVVAIVHHESRWQPWVVSADGEDYGLGQIRARWFGACRQDADPVHDPSPGCKAAKAALLSGEANLRRISVIIRANRELCKEKTGAADLPRWLAGYEGYNSPSRDRWCAPGEITWEVVEYRKKLVATFAPRPHPAKGSVAKAKTSPGAATKTDQGRHRR